ncbi:MAG: hypothetical protein GYB19_04795 [Rhodospirillales bacterium]|nr:hypothetical protein [Rhodospirillales bacterium]
MNGVAVQSFGFRRYLPIGDPAICAEFLNRWGIDEICLLDISPNRGKRGPDIEMIKSIASKAFVPMSYGGGLQEISDVHRVFAVGVDKVVVTEASGDILFLQNITEHYGRQAVVAGVDYHDRTATVCGDLPIDPVERAVFLSENGAGELLLHNMKKDGSQSGYDIGLLAEVSRAVTVPVIAMGGIGHSAHAVKCLKDTSVAAIAAGNILNHTEHSVAILKEAIHRQGFRMRQDLPFNHDLSKIGQDDRLMKRDESWLDDLGFVHVEREKI